MRDFLKHEVRFKGIHVVNKYRASGNPLAVKLSPNSLAPAGFSHAQMQAVLNDVLPKFRGDDVAQRVKEIVADHFWVARRSACKIQKHHVVVCRSLGTTDALKNRKAKFKLAVEVDPARPVAADRYQIFYGRRLGHGGFDFLHQLVVVNRNNHLNRSGVVAVFQILFKKHYSGRNCNSADPVQGQHKVPELVAAAQNQQNRVALADSVGGQKVGRLF